MNKYSEFENLLINTRKCIETSNLLQDSCMKSGLKNLLGEIILYCMNFKIIDIRRLTSKKLNMI